jgi:putative ATPase
VVDARDGVVLHQGVDEHYDQTSALIKSVRGSDPDAALYWLVRLLEAGESPRFLARRMVILASEDIGMADSSVLQTAVAAAQAVALVGMPEAQIILAHANLPPINHPYPQLLEIINRKGLQTVTLADVFS